jgi:VWFA-related protein
MGPRTALAVQLLCDQSAFLDPPPGELPATGVPNAASQQRMMDMARGYVVQTWPHLPDFFLTRSTARFDDSPQVLEVGGWPMRVGMHLSGISTRNLTFRDGKEIADAAAQTVSADGTAAGPKDAPERGLTTWGEFGSELSVILTDTAKGTVTFSHWEKTVAGLAAVFRYSVPKSASHYAVSYCCVQEAPITLLPSGSATARRSTGNTQIPVLPAAEQKEFHATPGYHGTLAVDPATGAVLRVTLEAELKADDPVSRAATVVQYGPVTIGDKSYICPVRSLAFSMEHVDAGGLAGGVVPILLVNETTFTHYRRLGTTMRILTDLAATGSPNPTPGTPGAQAAANAAAAASGPFPPDSLPHPPASEVAAMSQPVETAATNAAAPLPVAAHPPIKPEPNLEISVTAASGVPDQAASEAQGPSGGFQLKLTSRLVDVGIVAYDKKGHPAKDLKAEDFEIYDNGKKQEIRFFSKLATEDKLAAPADAKPDRTFSNRSPDATAGAPGNGSSEASATILLIDESHIAWPDMSHARQEILKFLATVAPGERVGLYSMTALGFRVLQEITTDHAALTAKLQKWVPEARSAALAQEEETRNRQSFNEVHGTADLNSVNGNFADVPDAEQTVDPQLRTMGSNPARAALLILRMVARHLSAVTGHKNLVWVSSDNVFADWQSQQVAIDKSPKQVDSFAMHAQKR